MVEFRNEGLHIILSFISKDFNNFHDVFRGQKVHGFIKEGAQGDQTGIVGAESGLANGVIDFFKVFLFVLIDERTEELKSDLFIKDVLVKDEILHVEIEGETTEQIGNWKFKQFWAMNLKNY